MGRWVRDKQGSRSLRRWFTVAGEDDCEAEELKNYGDEFVCLAKPSARLDENRADPLLSPITCYTRDLQSTMVKMQNSPCKY